MSIIFRYEHVRRENGTLRRAPFIPVYMRDKNNKLLRFVALLDSGADMTIVPKDVSIVLGLNEERYEEYTAGIGGDVRVKRSKISFQLKGEREHYNLHMPVLVLQDDSGNVPLLLGRNGLFEEFNITFRQAEEKIILQKTSKSY